MTRRCARRRGAAARARRAGARDHLHQRLCQSRERAPRARRRARGLAERVCHRLAPGAARNPRVRALLDHGAQRLSAAGRRRLSRQARAGARRGRRFAGQFHIVQSNGGVMSTATARALAGAHRAVRAGGRRDRRRGASRRPPASTMSITCDLGGTSFDVSRDRRRQGRARGADHDRFRPGHPHADDRDHHHRRRRRLDRLGRSRRPAAGRAGKRGLGAGAGLLRRRATRGRP